MGVFRRRTRRTQAIAAALTWWLLLSGGPLRAQDVGTPDESAGEAGPRVNIGPPVDDVRAADDRELVLIQDENGDWRAVPYSEQSLLENLLGKFSPREEDSPIAGVYISEFSLEGEIVDDRALMTATVAIEVTTDGVAFDVPLRLNQAHVEKISHDGPGRASPILDAPRDDGLHWAIEGEGTHRLELVFRVPLLRSPAGHQLLLTLPALPDYLVTRIRLRIPGEQVVRRQADIVDLQQQVGEDGSTELMAEVEGQRLDLVWTARRQQTDLLSSVLTTVEAQRDNEQFLLVGTQVITVEQGEISELLLQLPSEFTVRDLSLTSPRDQTTLTHEPAPEDPGWLRVSFEEPLHQKFTLDWTFERPFPEEGGLIGVDGLEVANAGSVQGEIRINAVDGFAVTWNESRSHGVRRVSLRDENARTGVWGAFEYRNPPFQLEIEIDPISPKTAAQAAYFLHVEANELLLAMDVSVQILTGNVRELQFVWPDLADQQWSIVTDLLVTSDSEPIPAVLADDGDQLTLSLDQPVAGTLHARLRFRRRLPEEESGVDLTLPQVGATWPARPTLFVGEAIDVTTEVTIDAGPLAEGDPASEDHALLLAEFAEDRVRGWELDAGETSLRIERARHQRSVTVSTSVTIGSPDDSVLQVVQEFAYEVAHGRIQSLLFDVPEQILEVYEPGVGGLSFPGSGLRFYDEKGALLESTLGNDRLNVALTPGDRHGSFVVRLEYALPLTRSNPGGREEYLLPIVQPLDAAVKQTAVHADRTDSLDVVALDSAWQNLPHFSGGSVYYVDDSPEECRLELRFSAREFVQRLKITACYLQTAIDRGGSARTSGVYVLEHPPEELRISLPAGHSGAKFLWNGEPVGVDRPQVQGQDARPFVLTLDEEDLTADVGRLVVNYQVDASAALGSLSRVSVGFPSFGPDVRIEETIWELVLPHQQLLSEFPEMMTPEFSWQRQTLLWMRSETEYVDVRRGEIVGDAIELPSLAEGGHRYAFSATGSVPRVRVGAMKQAFVVLIGAGIAMLLGFVFGRIPAMRSVYSLLVLAFVFALAAVWHLDLMQLLIQPALIGVCLALLAVKFDTATRSGAFSRLDEVSSEGVSSDSGEQLSSVQGSVASGVAHTALFRASNSSDSGSRPHD